MQVTAGAKLSQLSQFFVQFQVICLNIFGFINTINFYISKHFPFALRAYGSLKQVKSYTFRPPNFYMEQTTSLPAFFYAEKSGYTKWILDMTSLQTNLSATFTQSCL